MGDLVNTFTKLLTEFLEQNEKRHNDQLTLHDTKGKHIEELKDRLEKLETSHVQLKEQNEELKQELSSAKQREDDKSKEIDALKIDLSAQRDKLEDYGKWVNTITALVTQLSNVEESNDVIKEDLKHHHEVITDLAKQVRRCQQQCAYIPPRVPVKSATTSSFLNGNIHSSLPRVKTTVYQRNKSFLESFDADEEISELNDHAEDLKRGVEALNDLQRSFERSSFYSDE